MEYTCEEKARYATLNQTFESPEAMEQFKRDFIKRCNATSIQPQAVEVGGIKTLTSSAVVTQPQITPTTGASAIIEPEIVNPIVKPVISIPSPSAVTNLVSNLINPKNTETTDMEGQGKTCEKCKTCFWQYVVIAGLGLYILFGKKK